MPHPKTLLQPYDIDPKKSLGQNFLFDEQVLQRIVAAANITTADDVLEIGPGLGALTQQLAQAAHRVIAIELDDRLLPILRQQTAAYNNITIIHGDILEQNPQDWFAHSTSYKVVANVPYYITARILRHLLTHPLKPALLTLTIQKEVAERLTAVAGNMSLLAVSVQFYGRATLINNLASGAFWPRPRVASSVISINTQNRLPITTTVTDENKFFRLVRAGFSQKRKQLHKNLRSLGHDRPTIAAMLTRAQIEPTRRAETLSLEDWVNLYHATP